MRRPLIAGALAGLSALAPLPAAASDKVTVSYASIDAIYAPYFLGTEKGYFAAQGLEVELLRAGGGTATPALIAGSVTFSSSSGSAVSAMLKGAPLKVVMTLATSLPWRLWATSAEVRSLADLKGKPVGVETRGGLDELAMRTALLKAGLSQELAIFSPIGVGGVQRIAIMQSGTMPAIFLSYLEERVARGQGALANAHVLIDFGNEIQIPYNGLATSSAGLASNPDLTRRFLTSIMMGVRYMKHFRAGTLKVLEKYAKGTAPEHIAEAFDETMPTLLESGEASLEARETDLKIRGAMLGMKAGTGPTVGELYDYAQIRQALAALDASGWQPVE